METVEGLSGHADRNELTRFIYKLASKPERIIINHGDLKIVIGVDKGGNLRINTGTYGKISLGYDEKGAPVVFENLTIIEQHNRPVDRKGPRPIIDIEAIDLKTAPIEQVAQLGRELVRKGMQEYDERLGR